jgi:hypothetical protein
MHPRQANLLATTNEINEKIAAKKPVGLGSTPLLWKYVDPDGQEFYLPAKKMTVRSPYSGKSFSAKPEKLTIPAVGKEMKEEMQAPAGAPGPKAGSPKKKTKHASDDWKV